MPIDRSVGAAYADRIITLYVEVERELAALIAAKLKRGVAHDDLTQKMLALSEIRRSAEAAMRKIDGKTGPAVELALREAAAAGGRKAQEELLRVRDRRAVGRRLADVDKNLVNSPSILRLAASLAPQLDRKLAATHLQVVRSAGDIYQHAVAAMSVPGVLAGVATRREATQKALDHLWRKGITGFVDKSGRSWNLAGYVEMATRTTTAHAAIQAHLDQLGQQGMDLVMVSADGAPCPICRPWEGKILTTGSASGAQTIERASELDGSPVKVHIDGSTSEAIAAGLFHPSCFVGDTLVSSPSAVRAVDRRWYEGELVIIYTASGQKLTGTPNHPILTPVGWIPLGALHVGQYVLRSTVGVEREDTARSGMGPNDHEIPARIGDVFDALRQAGGMTSVRVPASPEQFHGDGGNGYVDVVFADRLLGDGAQSGVFDSVDQQHFVAGSAGQRGLSRFGTPRQGGQIGDATSDSIVRGGDLGSALLCVHGRPLAGLSLAAADLSTTFLDPIVDAGLTDAEQGRQLVLALARSVEVDQIISLTRRKVACHVYNLQTVDGFYVANKVIVHNCRHRFITYLPGLTAPIETAGEGGALYQAEQQQRGLERQARRLAVQQAGAIDPDAAKRYAAAYRAKRAEIKAHVDDHPGLRRKTERERIDLGHAPSAAPAPVRTLVSSKTAPVKPAAAPSTSPKSIRKPGTDQEKWIKDFANLNAVVDRKARTKQGDGALDAIGERQGFKAKPQNVTKAQLDEAIRHGWVETWRGVNPGMAEFEVTINSRQINDQLRHGDFFPGLGIYGNGTYLSVHRGVAEVYAGVREEMDEPGGYIRLAVDPGARIINHSDLIAERDAWIAAQGPYMDSVLKRIVADEGRYAAIRGYDVIRVINKEDGSDLVDEKDRHYDQYIILNRSVIMIQDTDPT